MTDLVKRLRALGPGGSTIDVDGRQEWAHEAAASDLESLEARVKELEAHCTRLGQGGAERYWENRYRDEAAANTRLTAENAALKVEINHAANRYDLAIASRLEWRRQAIEAQRENATLLQQRNEAFERALSAISSIPVYVDTDGSDPDDQRSAGDFRSDAIDALRNLSKES